MLTCKEASVLVSEGHDRKLRWHERLGLRIHLWSCANCRRFERQLRLIRQRLRAGASVDAREGLDTHLSAEARERIRDAITEHEKHGH
jgi:hypothetical protein